MINLLYDLPVSIILAIIIRLCTGKISKSNSAFKEFIIILIVITIINALRILISLATGNDVKPVLS